MSEVLDTTNVQDVFATTSILENAGGGCTRIYNCVTKNGVLVPVGYSIVYPTAMLLKAVQGADEFTRRLVVSEMGGAPAH
jgi:hypothetical protein